MVIYMRTPQQLLPQQWEHGLECTTIFGKIIIDRYRILTRALNAIYTISSNLTIPTDYIQEQYLPYLHNYSLHMRNSRKKFRLTVVSDHGTKIDFDKTGNAIPNDFYIIIVDNVEKFVQIIRLRLIHLENWNPLAYFYIIYHNSLDYDNERAVLEAISHEMHKHFAERIFVLFARAEQQYALLINNYLNAQKCRTTNWKPIGECNNSMLKPAFNLISLNLQQFMSKYGKQNCTLRVCATVSQPFVEEGCKRGLEIRILGTLMRQLKIQVGLTLHLQCTSTLSVNLQSVVNCTELSRGTLNNSGRWNGLLGELSKGTCDMIVGGFYPDNEVSAHFWVSQTYLEDSHTWFIRKAKRRPPWRALLAIFKDEVWLCFIVVLLITWLAWYFFVNMLPEPEWHKELSLTAINALAVSICVTANERPLYYTSRLFFYMLSLYGLTVMAIYTSRLIVVFKDPGYMYQIKTLQEVIDTNIPYGGPAENSDWFDNEPSIADAYNESEKFHLEHQNLLSVADGDRVILGGRAYMSQSNLSNRIYPFPDNVFSSPLQFFMTYGAPFQNEISIQLLYCNEIGIIDKISKDFLYNNTYLRYIAGQRPQFKEQTIVLTTEHFQGPFAVLIVGLFISILVFLAELQIGCFKKRMLQKENSNKPKNKNRAIEKNRKISQRNNTFYQQRLYGIQSEIKYGLVRKRKVKEQLAKPWFN